jgi:hypothetical protein
MTSRIVSDDFLDCGIEETQLKTLAGPRHQWSQDAHRVVAPVVKPFQRRQ